MTAFVPMIRELIRTLCCRRGGGVACCLSVVLWVGGCASTAHEKVLDNPSPLTAAAYPAAFDASIAVLRDAGFGVDRQDFRFGRVSSKPKGSPTILEAWKPDNTYADQAFRSTLGDLRRTVVVSFDSGPAGESENEMDAQAVGGYGLSVEVLIERLQVPQRRMNGATRGVVFADLAEVPEELRARGITQTYWQPVGRDVHLEQRLLRAILGRTQPPGG